MKIRYRMIAEWYLADERLDPLLPRSGYVVPVHEASDHELAAELARRGWSVQRPVEEPS